MSENKKDNMTPPKIKDFKGTAKRLFAYLKPKKYLLAFTIVLTILSTAFTILAPSILGRVTTELFDGTLKMANGTGSINLVYIRNTLLILLAIYVVAQIFALIQNYFITGLTQSTIYTLRKQVNNKINRLPLNYFDTKTHGEILSRITNDVDTISTSFQQIITQFVSSVFTIVGILFMMIITNFWLTLISLIVIPLSILASKKVVNISQKYFIQNQSTLGTLNGHVEEMYSGHTVVKAFNREDENIAKFNQINNNLYEYSFKSQFLSSIMMPVVTVMTNIGYILTTIVGGLFAISGSLSVGNIQAFIQYTRQFMMPMGQVAQIFSILQSTIASAERVFDVLDEQEEIAETTNSTKLEKVVGNVDFESIKFGYSPEKILITNLNLNVKSGQKIAIVGPTGAGKTTLINLLMRFYNTISGTIKIDGVSITDMTRDDLRSVFGMVLQDTWLFNGSIKDNISYGAKNPPSMDEIKTAAKLACANHFISTLPDGYDMVINEEASNLSGGQKQLLTIARAIISDPSILILDEATSSVDTRTEILIQKAMLNLMKDRTSFVIAHRLSTIKDADVILVLRNGDIVEHGTHDELILKKGFYEELYNSQFANQS